MLRSNFFAWHKIPKLICNYLDVKYAADSLFRLSQNLYNSSLRGVKRRGNLQFLFFNLSISFDHQSYADKDYDSEK